MRDSAGISASAPLLYLSPQQINFLVPSGLAVGVATYTITDGDRTVDALIMCRTALGLHQLGQTFLPQGYE